MSAVSDLVTGDRLGSRDVADIVRALQLTAKEDRAAATKAASQPGGLRIAGSFVDSAARALFLADVIEQRADVLILATHRG